MGQPGLQVVEMEFSVWCVTETMSHDLEDIGKISLVFRGSTEGD